MPRPHLLSQLVLAAADRAATSTAVVGPEGSIDYQTLAERVARFAGALVEHGFGPGDRLVVAAAKSTDTFVAMHGAMWAGGVAAPVDPASPGAAMQAVIADVEPHAAVVDRHTADRLPAGVPLVVGGPADAEPGARTRLDWAEVAAHDPIAPRRRTGDDLAYLITTSGSTGRPKAIAHTHRSGLRYAELAADEYGLGRDDRMASVAPFHFDQSTFELYAGPLAAAAVVLVPDVLLRFPASVTELLERERVTTWYSVPTILRHLLERGAIDRRDLTSIRWVLFGGEVFPAAQLRRLMELLPAARFSNVYGPAEVNQCTRHHLGGPPTGDTPVPIGRPWADTELRIDPDSGELLVRTATSMAGYWRRPDLDERAFLVEPADAGTGRRWYRTGDRVRPDDTGALTFLGRLDRQTKRRGVRIELEAIESTISAVDGVTGCAVIVDGVAPDGAPGLAAIVESATATVDSVVAHARRQLAPAAIPDRVLTVTRLPRTTSGKIDARAAAALLDERPAE